MEWISAKEDLPEVDRPVICRVAYGSEIDYGAGVRYEGRDSVSCERTGFYTITHWMYDDLQSA